MNMSSDSPVLLLGLQDTGKSNFILALDIVLGDLVTPDGLVHSELADDRSYVQPMREMWLNGEELHRTSGQMEPQLHQLIVSHPASGKRINFYIPDHAGESFSAAFVARSFSSSFCERIRSAGGLLVFVHANDNSDHELHEEVFLLDNPNVHAPVEKSLSAEALEFDPEMAAKQIRLVDLLQFVDQVRESLPPLRVAVVVSAWDLVINAPEGVRNELPGNPQAFVAKRWPLLFQYLQCNEGRMISRIFGVSARGGGASPEDIGKMLSHLRPADRVVVVDGSEVSRDISLPVRWVLGLTGSPK